MKTPAKHRLVCQRYYETHRDFYKQYAHEHRANRKKYCRTPPTPEKQKEYSFQYRFHHDAELRKKKAEYYQRNKERLKEKSRLRHQQKRDSILPKMREYGRTHKSQSREYSRRRYHQDIEKSRAKGREYARAYYHRNSEKIKAAARVSGALRRRCKILTSKLELAKIKNMILEAKQSLSTKCAYCGLPLHGKEFHADHIQPLSRMGRHELSNMAIACPRCNIFKGDKPLDEWLATRN